MRVRKDDPHCQAEARKRVNIELPRETTLVLPIDIYFGPVYQRFLEQLRSHIRKCSYLCREVGVQRQNRRRGEGAGKKE